MRRTFVLVALVLGVAASALAQPVVFVVRHAERADGGAGLSMTGADPELSAKGRERAALLAATLKDAKLTAIFATEFKRTQQTASPVATAAGLEVTTVPATNLTALAARITATTGNVLVVGHSNTVPDIIRSLGVETPITIRDDEYDNLYIVIRGTQSTLVRLHF